MYKNFSPKLLGITGQQSEVIELALSNGFRSIDVDVLDYAEDAKANSSPMSRRLIESARLKLGAFRLPLDLSAEEADFKAALERLPAWAAPAQQLGYTRCYALLNPGSDTLPYHQNFELQRQRLATVCQALEPYGLRLAVGFQAEAELRRERSFEFIHDLDALLLLLSGVGVKNIGLLIDLWQLHLSGKSLPAIADRLKPGQIVAVVVSDAPANVAGEQLDAQQRALPGEGGAIDGVAALSALANLKYDGPVTPSAHAAHFKGLRRDAVVRAAGEKLEAIWSAAGVASVGKAPAKAGL